MARGTRQHEVKSLEMADIQVIVDALVLPKVDGHKIVWTKPSNFWIPLIGLFAGMRKSEICQLHKNNFVEKDGVSCIQVSDKEVGQSLQFRSSHRHIPIHSKLVELGFLRFIAESKDGPLFPEIFKAGSPQRTSWTWFSRIVSPLLAAGNKGFNSVRPTFATVLYNEGASYDLIATLLGHANNNARAFISPKLDMSVYKEVIEKVVYKGVDFGRLAIPAP
jgi:integrase